MFQGLQASPAEDVQIDAAGCAGLKEPVVQGDREANLAHQIGTDPVAGSQFQKMVDCHEAAVAKTVVPARGQVGGQVGFVLEAGIQIERRCSAVLVAEAGQNSEIARAVAWGFVAGCLAAGVLGAYLAAGQTGGTRAVESFGALLKVAARTGLIAAVGLGGNCLAERFLVVVEAPVKTGGIQAVEALRSPGADQMGSAQQGVLRQNHLGWTAGRKEPSDLAERAAVFRAGHPTAVERCA